MLEGEPCVNNNVGTNGGCNATPPVFTNITPPQTWCGQAWANAGPAPNRDTDWYRFTPAMTGVLSATLTSEFPGACFIVSGISPCAPVVLAAGYSDDCVASPTVVATVNGGTPYVVFVATGTAGGAIFSGFPCNGGNNDYQVSISLAPPACGNGVCGAGETPVNCPADCECFINCVNNENEPCVDNGVGNNGGCNATPPVFNVIQCGTSVCGTIWANNNERDTDWHLVCVSAGTITGTLSAEIPAVVFIVDGIDGCAPAVIGAIGSSSNCTPGPAANATVAEGQYAVFVGTGNPDGSGIFSGFPCGSYSTYQLQVACTNAPACVCSPGNCYTPHNNPGCDIPSCCTLVCAQDPSCCSMNWDAVCAGIATNLCSIELVCGQSGNDCCQVNPDGGCEFPACCEAVCNEDLVCCFGAWDQTCVDIATLLPDCNFCMPCALGTCTGTPEPEPCGDDTNGGCNSTPAAFGAIAVNETICGTSWATGGTRDTDWYMFNIGELRDVTATVNSQQPNVVFLIDGIDTCNAVVVANGSADNCVSGAPAVSTLAPGSYAVFVGTGNPDGSGIFEGIPCSGLPGDNGNQYRVTLASSATPPACTLTCSGTNEPEVCGDDLNGGCNSTPPAFGSISGGETVCGTGWAEGGFRDTDWYMLPAGTSGDLTVDVNSEFPSVTFVIAGVDDCDIAVLGDAGSAADCSAIAPGAATLSAADTHAVFVAPGNPDGSGIFAGHPCNVGPGGSGNFYSVTVSGAGCPPCDGDTNGDCQVNVTDLVEVITNWGNNPANPAADFDGDGDVDVTDLVTVITNWGSC
jgi:hypothetical protein